MIDIGLLRVYHHFRMVDLARTANFLHERGRNLIHFTLIEIDRSLTNLKGTSVITKVTEVGELLEA